MAQPAELTELFQSAKRAAKTIAQAGTPVKDAALEQIAALLVESAPQIAAANELDMQRGRDAGMAPGLLDRLLLDEPRVRALAAQVREVIALTDPVGQVVRGSTLPNGLLLQQVRVPFGVIGAIYEARPNVTVDIAALALKSGNAVVLRGGSAAQRTNEQLVAVLQEALQRVGLDGAAVQTVDAFGRDGAAAMMTARGYLDVLIPRGSAGLIATVIKEATVPVIETGAGVVHIYVDAAAELTQALEIIENAKVQRPGVCNAVDTVLLHQEVAADFVPLLVDRLTPQGVTLLGDAASCQLDERISEATDETWGTEHLALRLGLRIVSDLDAALQHIEVYSTGHTEAVLSQNVAVVERFLREVDAASVIANASTRFTDGGAFGFGAEVGISTQKLHARGPMALPEMTSTKWITRGSGQIRS
ncbi:glutamate-5-semialdehyde dehydrogenase [Canibacter oris]|uniref:Gamma-glutamyl phosphate reductase n=1 Tax=Canibacter oris TaxID=1365628 RepID=A0A840DML0_9MICO|nr:glutamate-5-semialdehyde dehydrogenase [Canibacter oris]MBB4070799.1 glutamate-5-semialdehyde dehydrogenase [Canibacter oris]